MQRFSKQIICLAIYLPILFYYWFHCYFSLNSPQEDEIRTIMGFWIDFNKTPSFLERLHLLISPENESRPVYFRLVLLLFSRITGKLNFSFLMFYGISALIPIWYLLKKLNSNPQNLSYLSFVTALLIFQPQFYLCSFRADASVFYIHGLLFALCTYNYLVKNNNRDFALAIFFGILSILNSVAGLVVLVISLVYLLICRRINHFLILCIPFLVALFFIFNGNNTQGASGRFVDGVENKLWDSFKIAVYFLGSFAQIENVPKYTLLFTIGIIVYLFCIIMLLKPFWSLRINKNNHLQFNGLHLFVLYLLSTILLIGFTRWIGNYETTVHVLAIERSKKLFPVLILCCLILNFNKLTTKIKYFNTLLIVSALLFNFYSFWFYTPEISFIQRQVSLDAHAFYNNKSLASLGVKPNNPVVNSTFNSILKSNVWNFPTTFYAHSIIFDQIHEELDSTIQFTIKKEIRLNSDIDNKTKSFVFITNESFAFPEVIKFTGVYLLLKSSKSIYVLPTFPNRNSKLKFLKSGLTNRSGFNAEFENLYPEATYTIGVMIVAQKEKKVIWSKQVIEL